MKKKYYGIIGHGAMVYIVISGDDLLQVESSTYDRYSMSHDAWILRNKRGAKPWWIITINRTMLCSS